MPANIWKILSKNSPGTATTFAADDWDMPGRYMNDVDLTATAPSSIKTNTSFWDNRLRIWNPAKTKSYRIRGLAIVNDYDLTLPLLSSNDEIVGLLATQTLQNKQINVNNNTLKHGITNAIGDLLVGTGTKYDRLAMGSTGGYVLSIKNDLTGLEWVAGGAGGGETNTASNVGGGGVGIFKLKSGVDLQFKKLNTASGGLITVTDDTANSEIDLKITGGTDGQYLKTVGTTPTWSASSGGGIPMPDGSTFTGPKWGIFLGGAANGSGFFSGFDTTGTRVVETGSAVARTGYRTAAVDQEIAGWGTNNQIFRGSYTPRLKIANRINPNTERIWSGFLDRDNNDFPGGSNPLVNGSGIMFGFSEGDTNWLVKWNNGGASPQSAASAVAKDTNAHTGELLIDNATNSVSAWIDGTQIVNANTTQVPSLSMGLGVHAKCQAVGTTVTDIFTEWAMITIP